MLAPNIRQVRFSSPHYAPKSGGRVKEFPSRKYVVKLLSGFQFVMQRTQLPDFEVARA
jgi:hypothetical protein